MTDKSDPTNYRGICLSSGLGKLFSFILNQRVYLYFEEKKMLHNSQIGFLPENRTADHVFSLRTLIDKYVHYHKEKGYACLVDFRKAFDSVWHHWHEGLLYKLLKKPYEERKSFMEVLCVFSRSYHAMSSIVRTKSDTLRQFRNEAANTLKNCLTYKRCMKCTPPLIIRSIVFQVYRAPSLRTI